MIRGTMMTKRNNTPSGNTDVLPFTFNGSTLTKYTGNSSEVKIPSTYSIRKHNISPTRQTIEYITGTDYKVTAIGASAFQEKTSLTKVEIPSSITIIGASAFKYCFALTTVSVTDNTLYNIGELAFAYTKIDWPTLFSKQASKLSILGKGAFAVQKTGSLATTAMLVVKTLAEAQLLVNSNYDNLPDYKGYSARGTMKAGRLVGGRSFQESGSNIAFDTCIIRMYYTMKENNTSTSHNYKWMDGGSYKQNSSGGISYRGLLYGDSAIEYNGAPGYAYYFCSNADSVSLSTTISKSGNGTVTGLLSTSTTATTSNISSLTSGSVQNFYCHIKITG